MSSSSTSSGGGTGFTGLLTILFITLKLLGKIDWSWWWVLAPIWIGAALAVVIGVPVVFFAWRRSRSLRGRFDAYARKASPRDRGLSEAGALALLALVVVLLIAGIYLGYAALAPERGKIAVRNQTQGNGTYRIAAYEHFFDLCAGVQDREAAIRNAQDEEKTASQARKEQLQAVVTANRNERADLVNQYNADASKSGTQGQFRASNLPYRLSLDTEETQCTA